MEKCQTCGRIYDDNAQKYCVSDGSLLVKISPLSLENTAPAYDLPQTIRSPLSIQTQQTAQSNTKRNIFIFGAIAAVLFLLMGGVGILALIFVKVNSNSNSNHQEIANLADLGNNSNVNNNTPGKIIQSPSEKYKPELTMAIKSADDAQSDADNTYNTDALKNYYMGEALKSTLAQVNSLKKSKISNYSTLEDQDFEYFKVNDAENEAEVRVIETWTTIQYYTPTRRCLSVYKSQKMPQKIYLKKTDTGWMVNVIIYDPGIKQVSSPCPKTK